MKSTNIKYDIIINLKTIKMEFKIEKEVKIPSKFERYMSKYPFGEMEVGDSFIAGEPTKQVLARVSNAATRWAKQNANGHVFTCRTTNDGVRIWRTR